MSKKIFLIALIFSIAGLLTECMAFIPAEWATGNFLFQLNNFFKTIRASLFGIDLTNHNFDSPFDFNYLNAALYTLLLVGALLYRKTNGREMRLIRCLLAMIFAFSVFAILLAVLGIFYAPDRLAGITVTDWLLYLTGLGIDAGILFISFKAIKELTASRELELIHTQTEEAVVNTTMTEASKGDRFQNLLFDTIICFTTFFPALVWLLYPILREINSDAGGRFAASIVFALSRVLYYIFFETLFSSSPAKFLTETRVVDDGGLKPTSSTIIGRSWARIIPFDALSFLGGTGWHDSLSDTRVIDEKRTGVDGSYYYLVFPAVLVLAGVFYFGNNYYEEYTYRQARIREHQQHIQSIQQELSRLSTEHLIKIKQTGYSSEVVYLKIEEVKGDAITAYVFKEEGYQYFDSWTKIAQNYLQLKADSLGFTIQIQRSKLDSLFTTDSKQYADGKWDGFNFLGDEKQYEFRDIARLYRPNIKRDGGHSRHGKDLSLGMINAGWGATISNVEILEGSLTWAKPEEPIYAQAAIDGNENFWLRFENYSGDHSKLKITATDETGREFYFLVEGKGTDFDVTSLE